ncbi:MAG: YXWGXW repeat-containing protein, partial [Planctomycetes bacterium]|nr:YXWGXW repeat-containing protein [Planctomycetota bacterium]
MTGTCRYAGFLLAVALAATAAIGWGCDKHRRASVATYDTAAAPAAVTLPPPPVPPPATVIAPLQPQYPQAYEPAAAPAAPAAPAQPQYQQVYQAPPAALATPAPEVPGGVEVLARGPVHEAFAEPIVANPGPGMIVSVAPPGPIQEAPPADRPVGAIWIPGYWGWDDDQSNFIWVSGLWRVAPPGCRWVPGYWATVPDGAQWVPGFWLSASVKQVEYLPPPPRSLETGPVSVAPSADTIWVTGCWYHQGYQYAWRPGFWMPARSDWLWVPAHYIWTPRGCVFVAGYWDYGLGGRGLLFAPVRFARPMYLEPAYVYSPTVVIETRYLTIALFARPRYHHYYFGDYFEMNYVSMGFMPWYECRTRYDWYDPIYSYSVWSHRREDRWEDRERERYEYLRHDRDARPPHTLAMQVQVQQTFLKAPIRDAEHRPVMMAAPLSEVVARRTPPMRFEKLDDGRRNAIQQYAGQLRTYRDQRVAVEAGPDAATSATGPVRPGPRPAEGRRTPTAGPQVQTVRPDLPARPPIDERTPGRPALSPADNGKLDRPALLPQLPAALQPEARRPQPQPQPQPLVSPRPETRLPQPQAPAAPLAPRIVTPQPQAPSAPR